MPEGSVIVMVVCALAAAISTIVAVLCWRQRTALPAATAFAALFASEALWSIGHLGETIATTRDGKLWWDSLENLPLGALGPLSIWAAVTYVGARTPRRLLLAITLLAGPAALVLATAPLHGLVRGGAHLEGGPEVLVYPFTSLDFALSICGFSAAIGAAMLIQRHFVREHPAYAAPTFAVGLALGMPPLIVLIALSMGVTLDGDRDVTPIAFTIAALSAAWALDRQRVTALAPIGRDAVLLRLPDAVLVFDRALRVADANPAACALLGRPERELLGTNAAVALAFMPALLEPLRHARVDEIEIAAPDGARWYAALITPLVDDRGGELGRTLILHDITARRAVTTQLAASVAQRTAELITSEARFRALFDEVVSLVGLLDRDGRVVAANRTALRMIDKQLDELIGMPFWDTPWWTGSPAAQAQIRDGIARAAEGELVHFQTEHTDARGAVRQIDFSLTPVRDATGQVVQLIPEGRDVTDLQAGHARAERLAAQLHQAQKMESIGRLAGGIAHDFNNLLTVIRGNAEDVRGRLGEAHAFGPYLDDVIDAADAAAQITRQLLTFSRSEPLAPRSLALGEVIDGAGRLLTRLIRADVKLAIDLPSALWPVRADPTQLQQIVLNLALNAQDAMPDGGELAISAANVELDAGACEAIAGARPGAFVRLTVRDTGSGMDEATLAQLFEPFFTTKPAGKGTGLGLAVVHGAVYQSEGFVDVRSVLGRGTTFALYFPRAEPTARAAPPAPPEAPIEGGGTLLVLEDNAALRRVVVRSLEQRGHRVVAFASPAELLAAAAAMASPPDLLLTDIVLAGMNGVEVARRLVARWPALRVLFMSGYSGGVPIDAVGAIASDALIGKPFRPSELAVRIERALRSPPAWTDPR